MTIGISITLDKRDLERLREVSKRAPGIVARSLTATAKDAQTTLKGSASGTFHLRNSWVQQGIRIKAATSGSMVAQVGSIDRYMTRHVIGDDKPSGKPLSISGKRNSKGRLASGGLLIPAYGSIGNVPKHQKTRSKLRRMEGQKKKPFQIMSRGGMYVLIVRRTSKKRRPLEVLAKLDTEAEMDRTWPMDTIVEHVVKARFAENFGQQIVKAMG